MMKDFVTITWNDKTIRGWPAFLILVAGVGWPWTVGMVFLIKGTLGW